jgi:signal transduction histidine kinase
LIFATERIDSEQLNQRVPVTKANDELDRLAEVFNAMLDRLEKSFAQTKRFAADASHELRTPLTIMRGEIELLLREPGILPSHEGKLLSLQEEIDRLDRITESLLLLTHLDARSAALERATVNLSTLVSEACEDAELLGASRQVRVEVNIGEDIRVLGDSVHLRRILLNLLDNATKFNVVGGRAQCVLSSQEERAILCVRNTGPGIPTALSPRVFQRFFRADASRTGKEASHGLGLSLAREIARAHGGDLQYVIPREPGWTEFILTLPRCK